MKPNWKTTEKIERYREEIVSRNCVGFQTFATGGLLITGLVLLVGVLFSKRLRFVQEYFFFFLYFAAISLLARYCRKHQTKAVAAVYYAALLPIYVCSILMGTFFDPGRQAITIMVLLCLLLLFVIDKPWRMGAYVMFIAGIFAVCAYIAKPRELFIADMFNLLIYGGIGLGVNYFSLRDRMESVENYVLVREKSERDPLTMVLNRSTGEQRATALIEAETRGTFAILDIDNFKKINDTYGHQVGDEVLCRVAEELQRVARPGDIVWRLGGDEFAVYAVGPLDSTLCEQKFEQMRKNLSVLHLSNPACKAVDISVGFTVWREGRQEFEELYRSSDRALYEMKRTGKGGCRIHIT